MSSSIFAATVDVELVVWSTFVAIGLLGLLAVLSPKTFESIASTSSRWVNTEKLVAVLDKRVDVDSVVLKHSRLFGFVVLVSVLFLAYLYWQYLQLAG